MKDPIVIDPPGFDCQAGWKECSEYVDKCGGLVHKDGEPNWRAAFGADPGCVSCPNCKEFFWCWGRVIECTECHFQFPTDWWPMYAYGCQEAKRKPNPNWDAKEQARMDKYFAEAHAKRIDHPYYRYGFEYPPQEKAYDAKDKVKWADVFPEHMPPERKEGE